MRYATFTTWPLLLLLLLAGCGFDDSALTARQCRTDDSCATFGAGFACLNGYCQRQDAECEVATDCAFDDLPDCRLPACVAGACVLEDAPAGSACGSDMGCAPGRCGASGACNRTPDDSLCDNGLFCDGVERCAPQEAIADADGCISGRAPELDDGVECTVGRCDEALGAVVQDCGDCACCADDVTPCGGAPPCFAWTCSRAFTCLLEPARAGDPCDDGAECTTGDTCDDAQRCLGAIDPTVCDDGAYCNGVEICAPGERGIDARGCLTEPRLIDDGVACTVDTCDEDLRAVLHDASACVCVNDSDCQAPCQIGRCVQEGQASRCVFEPRAPGDPCDDGAACTVNDACTADLRCVGQPDQAQCVDDACSDALRCDPASPAAGPDGCVRLPEPLACGEDESLVLWLDTSEGRFALTAEGRTHGLRGEFGLYDGDADLSIARSESASPRRGEYFVYPVGFQGAYAVAPTVVLDAPTADNSFGDRFEVEARNVTAAGFELYVYRTDEEGDDFGKGPDRVAWSTQEAWLVQSWADRSPGARDASQGDAARRPVVVPSGAGDVVRFRGDWLDFSRPIANDFTVVIVFRSFDGRTSENWWNCPALLGGELPDGPNDLGLVLCGGRLAWAAVDNGFDLITETDGEYNDGQLHLVTLTRAQADGALRLRVDGAEVATGVGVTNPLDANPFLRLARHPTGSGAHDVDYGEVMLFNRALGEEALEALEAALMARWGL